MESEKQSSTNISVDIDINSKNFHIEMQDELKIHEAIMLKNVKEVTELQLDAAELHAESGALYIHDLEHNIRDFKAHLEEDESYLQKAIDENERQMREYENKWAEFQTVFSPQTGEDIHHDVPTINYSETEGEQNLGAELKESAVVLEVEDCKQRADLE